MKFNWRDLVRDFLLRVLKRVVKRPDKKPKVRKENIFTKDIHIPTWMVGLFTYITFVAIFVYELGFYYKTIIAILVLILGFFFFSVCFLKRYVPKVIKCDDSVTMIGLILVAFTFMILIVRNSSQVHFLITPIPAAVMLINIFLGPITAFIVAIILTISMTFFYDYNFAIFFIMFFTSLVSIIGTRNMHNRKDITKTGMYIGLINFLCVVVFHCFHIIPPHEFFALCGWGIVNGFISSIITIGLLPYLESFFSISTNIKLLELADFMQPVLKKMMIEAPGTYHHSIIVGNLAEAAAREIGANPLLVRVGGYYHDIGKIEKADYFVENKPRHKGNKHDELSPNLSSLVIITHVKDGVDMAKKMKFDKAIIDIIEQHHGTSLVYYFYHKAKKEYKGDIDEAKYRYPGPKPRTKEAAIIMLADSVEAATHTEEDFSHSHLKILVNKIINNKFVDGQFDECEITLADLHVIADTFVKTLTGIYHNRIAYPSGEEKNN